MKSKFKLNMLVLLCTQSTFAATKNDLHTQPLLALQQGSPKLYAFDARGLFGSSNKDIDLSRFSASNLMSAGTYSLNIKVNETALGELTLEFDHLDASAGAVLCIDATLLKKLDLRQALLNSLPQQKCLTIKDLSPDAYYDYDSANLSLDISLPLSITNNRPSGYIAPALFDKGVTSAYLNYNFNRYKNNFNDLENEHSNYLSLASGLNFAGFNFRHAGNFQSEQGSGLGHYQSYLNTLSTDILPLKSRLMLGDFNTLTYNLDSAQIRGMQWSSDNNMRPMSQRSYAPLIRGMANTNALLTIFQNGRKVYERTVPAGAFEISDITAISNNGDLTVQVTENGGEQHHFIVPMQGNLNLVRVGQLNYSLSAGQYKLNNKTLHDVIGQASVEYGVNNYLSAYAGTNLSQIYKSYLFGLGSNTRLGGLSLDAQYSQANINSSNPNQQNQAAETRTGKKYQLGYQYNIPTLGASLNISSQYQTQSFMSLGNSMSLLNYSDLNQAETDNLHRTYNLKQQFNLSLYQSLFDQQYGAIHLRSSQNKYWNANNSFNQYDLAYSNQWNRLNYSLGLNQTHSSDQDNHKQQRIYVSLSLPLDWKKRRTQVNANIQHSANNTHKSSSNIGFSGVYGENNQINYGVSTLNRFGDDHSASLSTNINYRLPQMQLGLVSSLQKDSQQYGLSASGAVVAHPFGITASNEQSETFTIIHAKNAKGADVINAWGVKLDRFGNAIYSNLSAYDINSIGLDTKNMPIDVQLKSNQTQVIPRLYSTTLVEFQTQKSTNILLNVHMENDTKIPIGTPAQDAQGQQLGMFGQSNQLFIENSAALKNNILVKWSQSTASTCSISPPKLPSQQDYGVFQVIDVECK